jgi:peptide/nickel transport system ATP-binding protein
MTTTTQAPTGTAIDRDVLLDVRGLAVAYRDAAGEEVRLVDDVSFTLRRGETLGLAGESGCGKTTTALSLLGLLPTNLYRAAGEVTLNSERGVMHIDRRTDRGFRDLRWRNVSIIFQGAMNALDPVMRVSRQIEEALRLHDPDIDDAGVRERTAELFEYVGINPERARQYPHEFSGGMRQRVMIALALACGPELIIGDEPTTALDVMMQAQILELLESLRDQFGLAMILITHDLSVLAETCDRVAIMYGGRFAEIGTVDELYRHPQHPYTHRLLGAFPAIGGPRELAPPIPGVPPDPSVRSAGCRFEPRCHMSTDRCAVEEPALVPLGDGHAARCLFVPWESGALDRRSAGLADAGPPAGDAPGGPGPAGEPPTWAETPGGMAMPIPDQPTGDAQ